MMNRQRDNLSEQTTVTAAEREASGTARAEVVRYGDGGQPKTCEDTLAREEPLEIRVRGRSIAVTMRTPGHDRELAAGFLFTEGLIHGPDHIVEMGACLQSEVPENTLNVFLSPAVEVDFERLTRHVFATSSCGVCGKASIEAVHQHFPPVASNMTVSRELLAELPARMRTGQQTFAQTGGLHAAAIFDRGGNLLVLREDVGRHNAVDKVLGHGLLARRLPFDSHLLLVSGRASFEIVQKALAARIPIVCAISAPSSLAVEFARESGQTLVGFLRGETLNVYSGPQRVGQK
jgi:FdhD protein